MICLKDKKIHFIGIGGVGVNALAKYALNVGAKVTGSDAKFGEYCKEIVSAGGKVWEGVNPSEVDGADIVVYSSAIPQDNAELTRARETGAYLFERQDFLREIASGFKTVVGIAGTHGKTTTTAMTARILFACKKNFAATIGGSSVDFGNYVNNCFGSEEIFLAEACEYRRHFLSLKPSVAVVTNVECDHPDCYLNYDSVKAAFDEYLSGAEIKIYPERDFGERWEVAIEREGRKEILEAKLTDRGCELYLDGAFTGVIRLGSGADYDFKNATFAVATAFALGVNIKESLAALAGFKGVGRRFESAGLLNGVPAYFDFAHHPTEIECVLKRASKYGRILAVFQPHTYSRTKAYFDDFVKVFGEDENIGTLVLTPTYAAREQFDGNFEVDAIARAIVKKYGKSETYVANDLKSAYEFASKFASSNDIVLFIGAGDIYDIKAEFMGL